MPKLSKILDSHEEPPSLFFSYAYYQNYLLTDGRGFYKGSRNWIEENRKAAVTISCKESKLEAKFKLGLGNGQGLLMVFDSPLMAEHFLTNQQFLKIWKEPFGKISFCIFPYRIETRPGNCDGQCLERGFCSKKATAESYFISSSYCKISTPKYPPVYISLDPSLISLYPKK